MKLWLPIFFFIINRLKYNLHIICVKTITVINLRVYIDNNDNMSKMINYSEIPFITNLIIKIIM